MHKVLKKLRKKPERVREQIAMAAAGGVTLLVVAVWIVSLGSRFGITNANTVVAEDEMAQPQQPITMLLTSLRNGIEEQRSELKQNPFSQMHDESNSFSQMEAENSAAADASFEQQTVTEQPLENSSDLEQQTIVTESSKDQIEGESVVY